MFKTPAGTKHELLTDLFLESISLLIHSLTVVAVRAKEVVPNFNILCKIAFAVAVVPSMEARVEKDNIEVQTAMAQTADKTVDPEAGPKTTPRSGQERPKTLPRRS